MGLFFTFFYNDMPMIYQVHSINILYTAGHDNQGRFASAKGVEVPVEWTCL
jgi:hypothetical protein